MNIKIKILSHGYIHNCDSCGEENIKGVVCLSLNKCEILNLCTFCLEKYYDKS